MKVERPSRYCGTGSAKRRSQNPRLSREMRKKIMADVLTAMFEICGTLASSLVFWCLGEGREQEIILNKDGRYSWIKPENIYTLCIKQAKLTSRQFPSSVRGRDLLFVEETSSNYSIVT
jgi:hypothetical protein